jgi:hypothetical protein
MSSAEDKPPLDSVTETPETAPASVDVGIDVTQTQVTSYSIENFFLLA